MIRVFSFLPLILYLGLAVVLVTAPEPEFPDIAVFGHTAPEATVTAIISGVTERTSSNKETGFFKIEFFNEKEAGNILEIYAEKEGIRSPEQVLLIPSLPGAIRIISDIILEIPERPPPLELPCERNADLNKDGNVNFKDFAIMLFHWRSPEYCQADFNSDGIVDFSDLSVLLRQWTNPNSR